MKKGWEMQRLGDIIKFDKVHGVHRSLPYVGLEDIESNTGRYIGLQSPQSVKSATFRFSTEHVLYGRLRPYLNKAFAPDFQGHCSTEIYPIKPSASLSREYLLYWLLADETMERINDTCTGARMPRADMNEVLDFDFPLPPPSDQQRIVDLLDEAFADLAIAQALVEKNVQNTHALFEGYLQTVVTQRGQSWVETTLGEAFDVRDGTHDSPKYHAKGFPLITSKNLKRQGLSLEDVNLIDAEDFAKINQRSAVHIGDVLFAMIGTIGNPTLVTVEPHFAIKNVALFKNPHGQSGAFLRHYLASTWVTSKMMREAKGTTQKFVGLGYLRSFPISIPPLATQLSIVERLDAIYTEATRLETLYERKLAALAALKKSLLHQAFSGEL